MKKKVFLSILIITSISLAGIIFSQFFWMHKSYKLRQEQFEDKVKISLKSVVNQLMEHNRSGVHKGCNSFCSLSDSTIAQVISPEILDTLIKFELSFYQIELDYEYAIYSNSSDLVVMGKYDKHINEIKNSELSTPLSCLWKKESYQLSIFFPTKQSYLIRQMGAWFLGSVTLVFVLLIGYFATIYMILRQKKLSEMKTDFMNNMTHELKTPISTISASCELLVNDTVITSASKVKKYASIIQDENNRLKNQVDRVLQAAVLNPNSLHLEIVKTDLHEIVKETVTNCSVLFSAGQHNLKITLDATCSELETDVLHLRNILSNLIENAIKYSGENPEIHLKTQTDGKGISISVTDNGIGISKDHQKKIFSRFYRVPSGDIHNVRGFGLGLYYVKTLTEALGGKVVLESELGKGSTFRVSLPFKYSGKKY